MRFPSEISDRVRPGFGPVDVLVVAGVGGLIYLFIHTAAQWVGPYQPAVDISLDPSVLPAYAGLSTLRMAFAFLLSLLFTLIYGSVAARYRVAERVMVPLLDVLQSVPILSFMPGIVLAMIALFPDRELGVELAAVILIFTSQAWNMTFSFYHSLRTVPEELVEASRLYRLSWWQRFTRRDLPFSAMGLVWNSMMSWAGGWFFLMAAETFTLADKDFRLPGLGSYLQAAANAGDNRSVALGIVTLVVLIVILDQVLWRPLIAWSDKFKVELTQSGDVPKSWFLELLKGSALLRAIGRALARLRDHIHDARLKARAPRSVLARPRRAGRARPILTWSAVALLVAAVGLGVWQAVGLMAGAGLPAVGGVLLDFLWTLLRVVAALVVGAAWTVPAGVAIGLNPRLARVCQPIVQVVASIPATAVFPVIVAALLHVSGGLTLASILLMLLGTQWYVLFNVIAGATAIPTDLLEAASVLKLRGWRWWRRLTLPAIFPYLVTGLLTATGGAWNASIVSEYVKYHDQVFTVPGLGSTISAAAAAGQYDLLLLATLTMALGVAIINRLTWKRLYEVAESKFRLA